MDTSILNKAIYDDPEPTPPWMFYAISQMTTKTVEDCRNVANWLIKKLDSTSSHVKRKVLMIIKSVSKSGDPDFARTIVLNSEEIKKYCNYRGPQDQVFGDAYNLGVRNAASEAISAVFERSDSSSQSTVIKTFGQDTTVINHNSGGHMQGIGSNGESFQQPTTTFGGFGSTESGGYGSISVQNSKGGLGPVYQEEKKETFMESIKNKMPNMPNLWPFGKKEDGMKDGYKDFKAEGFESFKSYLNTESYKAPTIVGEQNDTSSFQKPTYTVDPSWVPKPTPVVVPEKQAQGIGGWSNEGKVDTSGSVETSIIEEMCGNSGIRQVPTRQQLSEFCIRCQGVNSNLIASLLDEKLESQVWQVRNKALYCIEALIKARNDVVISYFAKDSDNIELQTISTTEALATKSIKCMKLLGKDVSPELSAKLEQSTKTERKKDHSNLIEVEKTQPTQKNTSLLEFDPFESNPKVEKKEDDDMFASMDVKDTIVSPTPIQIHQHTINTKPDPKTSILDSFFSSDAPLVQKPLGSPKLVNNTNSPSGLHQQQYVQPIVYIVNPGPVQMQQRRVAPQNQLPPQRNQSFDFLKEEKKEDSHFDFIKQEMAQKIQK